MITITCLVTIYNKERYIAKVIESLKAINGPYRTEFIFIDDGSTDHSLEIIREHTASLKNVLIITQKNQGPAIAINKGISVSNGDYVFFVDGDNIIDENGPTLLLNACKQLKTDVAFGARGRYDPVTNQKFAGKKAYNPGQAKNYDTTLITSPLPALLKDKTPYIRSIGSSGSLVKLDLLKKIGGCDENIFIQNFSLALRCAKYSNFAYVDKEISFEPLSYDEQNLSSNKNYEYYNSLKALANFIENNPEIITDLKNEFHHTLWSIMKKIYPSNFKILYQYILSKLTATKISASELLSLYQKNINKLYDYLAKNNRPNRL